MISDYCSCVVVARVYISRKFYISQTGILYIAMCFVVKTCCGFGKLWFFLWQNLPVHFPAGDIDREATEMGQFVLLKSTKVGALSEAAVHLSHAPGSKWLILKLHLLFNIDN